MSIFSKLFGSIKFEDQKVEEEVILHVSRKTVQRELPYYFNPQFVLLFYQKCHFLV